MSVVTDVDFCANGVALQHAWDPFGKCRSCGGDFPDTDTQFAQRLQRLLNAHSRENASGTPDFILAQYLLACLAAWNTGVQQRETWYGRDARPTGGAGANLDDEQTRMSAGDQAEERR